MYGLMAEFATPEALVEAAKAARAQGYIKVEGYAPQPVEGLSDALGYKRGVLPWLVLAGGLTGLLTGFGMQTYSAVFDYPHIIGGKPYFSWPSFVPITYELGILFAAGTAVLCVVLLNGLPRPYHPVFNVDRFEKASIDRFFLCVEAADPKFDLNRTRHFLKSLQAVDVYEVPE